MTRSDSPRRRRAQRTFKGLGVSAGIALGPAYLRESGGVEVPEYTIEPAQVEEERRRLRAAAVQARGQILEARERSGGFKQSVAREIGYLLDAHLHMLDPDSRLIRAMEQRIGREWLNAESIAREEIRRMAEQFDKMSDPYLAARAGDVREVGRRLLSCFNESGGGATVIKPGSVIITDELTAADTVLLGPGRASGFAAASGGPESHAAIMARALRIPAVLGVTGLADRVKPGDTVLVDGESGVVTLHPNEATLALCKRRLRALEAEERRLEQWRDQPARTKDGARITLMANIELPAECDSVRANGAEGIGLLRSEFLYMNRSEVPDENEQSRCIIDIMEGLKGLPVTIRTLDVGGEKLAPSLDGHFKQLEKPDNPALGLRAIRFTLKFPQLLEAQLKAILRAATVGPVKILLPMISSISEIRRSRTLLEKAAEDLTRQGVKTPSSLPPLGVMIETPGAALAADMLARHCDFFSIGTNDLTMYTLAIDRGNRDVAHLYNPVHPALLRLIRMTTDAAWREGIPSVVCGEVAGDVRYTALLIGLGAHELSMAPAAAPRVKERILSLDAREARRLAGKAVDISDQATLAAMLEEFNRGLA